MKLIEIATSGASRAGPWKTVILCIWGWSCPHLHDGWHQDLHCHFWLDPGWAVILGVRMRDPDKNWRPRSVGESRRFDLVHARLLMKKYLYADVWLVLGMDLDYQEYTPYGYLNLRNFLCLIPHLPMISGVKRLSTWFIVNIRCDSKTRLHPHALISLAKETSEWIECNDVIHSPSSMYSKASNGAHRGEWAIAYIYIYIYIYTYIYVFVKMTIL